MGQIAAALLFAVAAGLGITVILAMVKNNADAVLSALAGEGAFPIARAPESGPSPSLVLPHRRMARHETSRPAPAAARTRPPLSCAA